MKTTFRTTEELLVTEPYRSILRPRAREPESPLQLNVIPDRMGINLVSVEGLSWTKQDDGQLVSLTIHFIPAKRRAKRKRK